VTVLDRLTTALADRYAIEREIGAGGMATVFLARDVRHERRVAIKVLHPELSAMLGPERFLSEIKLTASLQHPNVLPLFDSGVADGLLYYVMPFVEGETLRRRLERERQLPVADAVRLATEIAEALHYAHERGIVHRDIKPENVLLQSGRAMVADFGIALAVQHAGGTRMTQTGMSLGTPQYMAPEQAMGERNIDARADVYALGAVTYEMLAGEPPFTGPTAQAIVAKVMTERARPLHTLRDTVPQYVDVAVATALEKLPADRFASAAQFASALDKASAGNVTHHSGARTAPGVVAPSRSVARTAMLVGAALVAGGAIGAFAMKGANSSASSEEALALRFAVTPPDSVRLRLVCCGQMFAISPNGRWLVFQGSKGPAASPTSPSLDRFHLYLRDLTDLSTRELPGTESAVALFFSPNSNEIGFVANREIKRIALDGAQARTIAAIPDGFIGGASWAVDDTIVFGVGGLTLKVGAAGGEPTPLFDRDTTNLQFTGPQRWPSDGVVLYTVASQAREPVIEWRSLATNAVKTVAQGATPVYVESQRALLLVREDGSLMRYPFNLATGDTTGPGIRIATNVARRSPIVSHAEYTASQTGTVVLVTRKSNQLRGASIVRLGPPLVVTRAMEEFVGFTRPVFSPKGDVVVTMAARDMGNYTMQLFDVTRGVNTRAPVDEPAAAVTWTSTGDSLVYRVGPNEFRVRATNGSGTPTPPLVIRDWTMTSDGMSAWGPWIAFTGVRRGGTSNFDVVLAHRDSGGAAHAYASTSFLEADPAISPDGKWLAYTSNENGREDVWVSAFPVATGRYVVSTSGGRAPHWSRDSRSLYFFSQSYVYAASFTPGAAGAPPAIGVSRTIYTRDPWGNFSISPDGQMMMMTDRAREGDPQALVVNVRGAGLR